MQSSEVKQYDLSVGGGREKGKAKSSEGGEGDRGMPQPHTCSHLIPNGSLKATIPTPLTRHRQLYAPFNSFMVLAPASNRNST